MRKLFVLRGAPAVGKTTWVKEKNLIPYTLSFDNIRMLFTSPIQTIYGKESTSQKANPVTWTYLFKILDERMKDGELTVIDAINDKEETLNAYVTLAKKHRYEVFLVDFTDIPAATAKYRNVNRTSRKRVPESTIEKLYHSFKTEKVPSEMKVIKPNELNSVFTKYRNLSKYKKVHHIGDIHGCYETMMESIMDNGGIKDDEFYIFLGDYVDRGIRSADVLTFMMEISKRDNVVVCEGNHEKWLWNWIQNEDDYIDEFRNYTLPDLITHGISKADVKEFCESLAENIFYNYKGKTVMACHGGLADIPNTPDKISAYQYIHGVGLYNDVEKISDTFKLKTPKKTYEVFGHRNPDYVSTKVNDRVFCLECGIDKGGNLRWLTLDDSGFSDKQYKNDQIRPDRCLESA